MNITIVDHTKLVAFWLIFSRWISILIQIPLLSESTVPMTIKVLTSLVISYAFYDNLAPVMLNDIYYIGENYFWILTIYNTAIGLCIGFFVKAIMITFAGVGSMMSQQIGFGGLRYIDPSAGAQVGPFEKIIGLTMLVIILFSGALKPMFQGIYNSFFSINLTNNISMDKLTLYYVHLFKELFKASIILASPILFTNLISYILMGIISRAVPQMNILVASFSINIFLGLFIFIVVMYDFFINSQSFYINQLSNWFNFLL
jgi:flagellar biosynthesis protein FliR